MELYLKPDGIIGFVMPFSSMSRRQFWKFRRGIFASGGTVYASVKFVEAWAMREDLKPLFPVPSCVLFARFESRHEHFDGRLPKDVTYLAGKLPRRDATNEESTRLSEIVAAWPGERSGPVSGTAYSDRFRDGAVVFPIVLLRVEHLQSSLGQRSQLPLLQSRPSVHKPWNGVSSIRGTVESEFVRPLLVGESVAPFRMLSAQTAVVPWSNESKRLLDAAAARREGHTNLAKWMGEAQQKWDAHGTGKRTFLQQIDYFKQMSAQFPVAPIRIVYTASGTYAAAAIVKDERAVVEHKLYWMPLESEEEGHYLTCILNSEAARSRVEHLQSRGQFGTRDFDKLLLGLPIPSFSRADASHRALAEIGAEAAKHAEGVQLPEQQKFRASRKAIREALASVGIAVRIEHLVERLLVVGDG